MGLLVYVLATLFIFCYGNPSCEQKYRNITPDHSMCTKLNKTCSFERRPKRKGFGKELIQYHNVARNNVNFRFKIETPIATNMLEMKWDNELYEIAKEYLILCNDTSDCDLCHQTGVPGFHVEQNFAVKIINQTIANNTGPVRRFRDIIFNWADELNDYKDPDVINNFQIHQDLKTNWTNILRANTDKVGCASMHFKIDTELYKEIYICNYGPSEKIKPGEQIYKQGKVACSECPDDLACGKTYERLCGKPPPTGSGKLNGGKKMTLSTKATTETSKPPPTGRGKSNGGKKISNSTTKATTETNAPQTTTSTEENRILWKCEFGSDDFDNCDVEIQCYQNWENVITDKENFKKIRLPEHKTSGLLFLKEIYVAAEACFSFQYKLSKETIFPLSTIAGIVFPTANITNTKVKMKDVKYMYWNQLQVNVPFCKEYIQVGIAVRSNSAVDNQVIHIKEPTVHTGLCP